MKKITVKAYHNKAREHLKWSVNYRQNGNRSRRFFELKKDADGFAKQKNEERRRDGLRHAEFSTSLRVMAQEAEEALKPFGKSIRDAVQHYVAHLKASEKSCTAVQLVTELVAAKEKDGASQRHLSDLRSRLGIFAEKFDSKPVAVITSAEIDDWLRSIRGKPATRNHYRRLVILAFSYAVKRGYATSNPAKETAKVKEHTTVGILTVTEATRLLVGASDDVLPYVAIGLFAGLRRAEIERLDWSEVDFDSGLIEVTAKKSKTGARRLVTIQPNLREWLLPFRRHAGSVVQADTFRESFDKVRAAAGITEWPENALRHSFASYHLAHFKNAASTALELGHINADITFRHYRELVRPKDAERYWNITPTPVTNVVQMQRTAVRKAAR
jgi:integrase